MELSSWEIRRELGSPLTIRLNQSAMAVREVRSNAPTEEPLYLVNAGYLSTARTLCCDLIDNNPIGMMRPIGTESAVSHSLHAVFVLHL